MGHISAKAISYLLKNTKNTDLQGNYVTTKKSMISNQKTTINTTENNSYNKNNTTGYKDIQNTNANFANNCNTYKCEICIQANITNSVPKVTSNNTSYKYLDKISSDLYSLITPLTYDNYQYFITFLGKKTKYLKVALLKLKDKAYNAFLTFKAKAENQTSLKHKIKILSSDNGTEYVNKRFKITLNKAGIIYQTTALYTKEQNGNAKRINRTLLNKVRCILLNSNLPQYM